MVSLVRSSLVLVAIGVALLAFGLHWIAAAVNANFEYERSSAACATAPDCGFPPPPVESVVAVAALFVAVGAVPFTWGMVRLRQQRCHRLPARGA